MNYVPREHFLVSNPYSLVPALSIFYCISLGANYAGMTHNNPRTRLDGGTGVRSRSGAGLFRRPSSTPELFEDRSKLRGRNGLHPPGRRGQIVMGSNDFSQLDGTARMIGDVDLPRARDWRSYARQHGQARSVKA